MIVVDVNAIAYLLIPGKFTTSAECLLETDAARTVPRLWRSELRNILASYLRVGYLDLTGALALYQRASVLVGDDGYEVNTAGVLRLSEQSKCSAYDCEYVCLMKFPGVELVTADAKLAKAFPGRTRLLSNAWFPRWILGRAGSAHRQRTAAARAGPSTPCNHASLRLACHFRGGVWKIQGVTAYPTAFKIFLRLLRISRPTFLDDE